jgi:AraC-like DNA-binding protein
VSKSTLQKRNRGAYDQPFSGVGVEFYPLGVPPDHSGAVLHETGYLAHNDWWNFPDVLSPFWRLYYNFDPGHSVVFGEREIPLTPRHILLIPDGHLFHCRGCKPVRNLWLAFSSAFRLESGQPAPILLRPTRTELALLRDVARLIGTRSRATVPRRPLYHRSLALLHLILARPELRWQTQTVPEGIRRATQHIRAALDAPLALPELARQAGLSVSAFTRHFRRCHGVAPTRFIMQGRVREAARLLAQTGATIEEIAGRTGFPNRAYFSRVFAQLTGEPPAHFRRVHAAERPSFKFSEVLDR